MQATAVSVSTNKWPMFDDDGKHVLDIFGIRRDIAAAKMLEAEMRSMASPDVLIGVENRGEFIKEIERMLALHKREESSICATMMLDIDHCKHINDT